LREPLNVLKSALENLRNRLRDQEVDTTILNDGERTNIEMLRREINIIINSDASIDGGVKTQLEEVRALLDDIMTRYDGRNC